MRIAVLTKHTLAHGWGGVQIHADGLAHGLGARGHEVVVLTTSLPGQPEVVRADGIELRFLPDTESNVYSRSWWRESAAAFEGLHRQRPFDLVLSEDLAGSSLIRRFPRVPHLPFVHGLALEHAVSELRQIEGVTGALRYPAIKVPELIYYAATHELPLIRRASQVGVVTHRLMRLIRRWYRVPEEALRWLPSWVDVDLFRPDERRRMEVRRALGIPRSAFVFLMASVLTKQKGLQVGLEAFARCRSVRRDLFLLIVGDGPYRRRLEKRATAPDLSGNVRFVGAVPPDEMAVHLQAADAFLFPTLRVEGLPFILLEAMATALPVIASRIGGVPEAVGDAGILLRPGDAWSLVARMRELLRAPDLARRIGEAGRERVKRFYSKAQVLTGVEEACRDLIGRRDG